MSTPYMNLTLPTVSVTAGPLYGTENNTAFTTIDSHNHTSGQGAQVPTLGININANLSFATYYALQLGNARFVNQGSPLATASDVNCVYFSGGNCYVNDSAGNQIQMTAGGAVNSSAGNISGMGATTASVTYTVGNTTFTFWSNNNVPAALNIGAVVINETGATSPNGVTIQSAASLASAYSLTLPAVIAATNNAVLMSSNAGVLSFLSLGSANLPLKVNSAGTALQYATLDTAGITDLAVTAAKIASATITGTQVSSNINLPGNTVQENAKNVVVSNTNAASSLGIVRGTVGSGGTTSVGEGFSSARNTNGDYTITFTTAFASVPVVIMDATNNISYIVLPYSVAAGSFNVRTQALPGLSASDADFSFIAVGPRS